MQNAEELSNFCSLKTKIGKKFTFNELKNDLIKSLKHKHISDSITMIETINKLDPNVKRKIKSSLKNY